MPWPTQLAHQALRSALLQNLLKSRPCPPNGTFGRIQQVGIPNPEGCKGKGESARLSGVNLSLSSARNLYTLGRSHALGQNTFNVNVINLQCSFLNYESSIFQV